MTKPYSLRRRKRLTYDTNDHSLEHKVVFLKNSYLNISNSDTDNHPIMVVEDRGGKTKPLIITGTTLREHTIQYLQNKLVFPNNELLYFITQPNELHGLDREDLWFMNNTIYYANRKRILKNKIVADGKLSPRITSLLSKIPGELI